MKKPAWALERMQTADLKVTAIATRAVPFNESDMIVTLVGVDTGVISATARGCLKPKAKLRYSAEPMNYGNYVLTGKNGRYVIKECSQKESFCQITQDIERYYAGSLTLEVLQRMSKDAQPELFMLSLKMLNNLAYTDTCCDALVTDYLLGVLEIGGNKLDFEHCGVCKCNIEGDAYFKDADGIVCPHCKGFNWIAIDGVTRAYLAGQERNIPHNLRVKANLLLADFVYTMMGVRIGTHYFTEQI